jgi:hypothetical protein
MKKHRKAKLGAHDCGTDVDGEASHEFKFNLSELHGIPCMMIRI